jgi:hypothetical protein
LNSTRVLIYDEVDEMSNRQDIGIKEKLSKSMYSATDWTFMVV